MKKLSLLLASIGAGLLLVGGTVAAYLVTAADTIGVRVTPGDVTTDSTGNVTLSWATNTIAPVGNLEFNEETDVGVVKLASDGQKEAVYTGKFKYELTNLSEPTGRNLLDYLTLKVYKAVDPTAETVVYGAASTYNNTNDGFGDTISAKTGEQYKITVTLKNTATDYYVELADQTAYLTLDWGPASEAEDASKAANVYFVKPDALAWEHVYFYAYKGSKIIKSFPGVEMNYEYKVSGGKLYSLAYVASSYDHIVFNGGTHTGEYAISEAAAISGIVNRTAPCYTPGEVGTWGTKPPKLVGTYYVKGQIGGENYWSSNEDQYEMTLDSTTGLYKVTATFAAGDEIKVYKPATDQWFGPTTTNWVITENGSYNVYVKENAYGGWDNGMYVEKVSATPAPYYVLGDIGGAEHVAANWDITHPDMTLGMHVNPSNDKEYMSRTLRLKAGDIIKVRQYGATGDEGWYGPDDNWGINEDGNYLVIINPTQEPDGWTNHMWVSKL